MKILIAIFTCADHSMRRHLLYQTWLPIARQTSDLDTRFIFGTPSRFALGADEIELPAHEGYINLPLKTFELLKYFVAQGEWDYLFKCDDDTYLHPTRLRELILNLNSLSLPETVYLGALAYPGDAWTAEPPYASGGAGYLLSRKAVELIGAKFWQAMHTPYPDGAEDLIVGRAAHFADVSLIPNSLFVPYGDERHRPLPTNNLITTHQISDKLFLQTHTENFLHVPQRQV